MSVSWADYQSVSIKRWIRGIGDIVMALVILTEDDEKEAIEHILRRCAIILIPLSVIFVKYLRVYGIFFAHTGSQMWVGVSTHKNNLALLCAFSAIFLVWRFLKSWPKVHWADVCLLILDIYLLNGSKSATSMIVVIIGIGVFFLEAMAKGDPKKLNTGIVAGFVSVVVIQQVFMTILNQSVSAIFFSATGRNATFTDRLPLWKDLLRIGSGKALLGAGFGSFWLGSLTYDLWAKHPWRPTNGHNGYIDVFMDLGLLGVILLGFWIFQTYAKARAGVEDHWGVGRLLLAYLMMILFHNVTESSLAMPTNFLWVLFLLTTIAVVKRTAAPDQKNPSAPPVPSF
jgi:O-antigen ligase